MRVCEECGVKMPRFKPRMRDGDGRLLCAGCHPDGRGAPGRPVGHHGATPATSVKCERCRKKKPIEEMQFMKGVKPNGDLYAEGSWMCSDCRGDRKRTLDSVNLSTHPELQRGGSLQFEAHDSGDGKIIYHCPFCGGGDVVGRSDGTAMCDFCHTAFTVQVQPERSAMPQTSPDGTPLDMPGMPGDPAPGNQPPPGETAPPGAGPPPGDAPGVAGAPATPPPGPPPGPPPPPEAKAAAASYYLTAQGMALDEDSFIRHLAIKHADDKAVVIEDVRKSNRED